MTIKKTKSKTTACIAIALCFFVPTTVFCWLLANMTTDVTDFIKCVIGWSICWSMIIHRLVCTFVFEKK